jgi:hypothetical protein
MLLSAGADPFDAGCGTLLPIHVACDPHAAGYRKQVSDGGMVEWLLAKMRERRPAMDGTPEVVTWLRTELPAAFWSRGCDPTLLGVEAPQGEARAIATYHDLDDPLVDD